MAEEVGHVLFICRKCAQKNWGMQLKFLQNHDWLLGRTLQEAISVSFVNSRDGFRAFYRDQISLFQSWLAYWVKRRANTKALLALFRSPGWTEVDLVLETSLPDLFIETSISIKRDHKAEKWQLKILHTKSMENIIADSAVIVHTWFFPTSSARMVSCHAPEHC
jgi:hypothetical protein